ncbi:hypothetical protein Z043_109153 [Scleropages formosus]|uniref:Uncharacterized protein n=1 Tax=Scleropages formosus TaxID=113540 RepID=A0A0P7YVA1_SCLFO|nr:hypothetical protein Z043_109153 [Scleropages formosus]
MSSYTRLHCRQKERGRKRRLGLVGQFCPCDFPSSPCWTDLSHFRPVYAPKDFLEASRPTVMWFQVLTSLRNPNLDSSDEASCRSHLGLIQVSLNVKDIPEMREFFCELSLEKGQLGIDDHTSFPPDLFESDHICLGKKGWGGKIRVVRDMSVSASTHKPVVCGVTAGSPGHGVTGGEEQRRTNRLRTVLPAVQQCPPPPGQVTQQQPEPSATLLGGDSRAVAFGMASASFL